jgi:hypothetical protein
MLRNIRFLGVAVYDFFNASLVTHATQQPKKFSISYEYNHKIYSIDLYAESFADAEQRIKALVDARVDGETEYDVEFG